MENIYLPLVLNTCFSHYIKFYGDNCKNSNDEELCDAYLRDQNKICLIEFKDTSLNASIKNSAEQKKLLSELDKKFVANQTGKPKGITQLLNAIKDLEANSISFDDSVSKSGIQLYPISVYTDLSFGKVGLDKTYNDKFGIAIDELPLQNIIVMESVFYKS